MPASSRPKTPMFYKRQQWLFALALFMIAVAVQLAPARSVNASRFVGAMLCLAGALVFIQGFQRMHEADRHSARLSGGYTILMGLLFVNAEVLQSGAVVWLAAVLFASDAVGQFQLLYQARKRGWGKLKPGITLLGNVLVTLGILFFRGKGLDWIVSVAGSLRIAGLALEVLSSPPGATSDAGESAAEALNLPQYPALRALAEDMEQEDDKRARVDRGWIFSMLLLLFFIHLGRMGTDRSATGLLSPAVALIGDIAVALFISFLLIYPLRAGLRGLSRPFERKLWRWHLAYSGPAQPWYHPRSVAAWWLRYRLRSSVQLRKAGYSLPTAIRSGLKTGLPFSALLVAIVPVFGMSWYFDTENWASGIWDSWAAARADAWRVAMTDVTTPQPGKNDFRLQPAGVHDSADFSFVVIGDPGEGDASQYILHDQLVRVSEKPAVKFVVVSSDVVYPDGAMKDYEKAFWLPMMGVKKPVYAIPGNHDWYDALEGFNASFMRPDKARAMMLARREADLKLTTALEDRIDQQLAMAQQLRQHYRVPTGFQESPYFQISTSDFVFIAIETGVLRRVDDKQLQWLKQVLEASRGKFIFCLLGHPFYAIGEYQGDMNEDFAALHQLLRQHKVHVVMAGDTHDLEYYQEPLTDSATGTRHQIQHFVNGGGGAYLSIGAALRPRTQMPQPVWAHYPATAPLVQKIERHNSWLKRPAWQWTKHFNGWPFSAEWLSAAFDYNVAPFFQSFMEVSVERSRGQVRLLAYTPQGPLTWGQLEHSSGLRPTGKSAGDVVEWIIPLPRP
ncbi:MAG: metallophosphoesterase [Chitinophagaceae bacterium]|nr:metallophosphoesterase [Chitinophagaceae bacterium]